MLTLFQLPRGLGAPNLSPFCSKLETYLRMAKIPYQIQVSDTRKAPKGKVPWIEHEGHTLGDSSLIIEYLKQRFGDPLDGALSPAQRALGRLVQRTLEEGTYWVGVYDRWAVDENFERIREPLFGAILGRPLIWVVPDLIRKRMLGVLYAQGTSRHTRDEVYAMARADFEALSQLLGDQPFLFGEQPTSYDAVLYAFTAPSRHPSTSTRFRDLPLNLRSFAERVHQAYFPELP
ncbi:MAG: glutathione S-transferase family protein [Myxococcales bacterium]